MKYSDRHISDEELDQLFRDAHASEGPEALFVPEFWSEMEAMLPAEQKKKRGFYWIPLAATAVLFGIILWNPSSPAKIDRIAQDEHSSGNEGNLSAYSAQSQTHTLQNKNENESSLTAESSNLQTTSVLKTVPAKRNVKTVLKTQEKVNTDQDFETNKSAGVDDRGSFARIDVNKITQNREESDMILDQDVIYNSHSELDSINLEARYENAPQEEVLALPKKLSNEFNEWYVELGPTLGQSPYLSPNQKRNIVGGAVFGGGYIKRIDNAFVSFGLQARMEGFGGLEYRETNFAPDIVRTVSVKQLYSLEVPLKFGYTLKRSEFAVSVTPGLQLFLHGKERITENQLVQRENTFTGRVEHSNSLTMEFGFQYYYNFTSRFSLGAKLNADILRPFHTDYYLGKSAGLPVNGQIVFRTRFSK